MIVCHVGVGMNDFAEREKRMDQCDEIRTEMKEKNSATA